MTLTETRQLVVDLWNAGPEVIQIAAGDRCAQLILQPRLIGAYEPVKVEALDETTRGAGGFGSTGR